jgi:hypothetical protein
MRLRSVNEFATFAIITLIHHAEIFGDGPKLSAAGGGRLVMGPVRGQRRGSGTLGVVEGRPGRGGLVWGSMEAGKASRPAMGSGLLRAAHVREDRPPLGDPCDT